MTDFIVRPLLGATIGTIRTLAAWARAITAAGIVFVLALIGSAVVEALFVPWFVSSGTYQSVFVVYIVVTLAAMGVVGRAQLNR